MQINFPAPLVKGTLIKRYKRFLTDVKLGNDDVVTAHCTNSGSMKSCIEEGAEVYLTPINDPKRKTKFTWEMIKINGSWVGINTSMPNMLAFEYIKNGIIPGLEEYTTVKREVKYGDSRFDIYAENKNVKCFVEVKNVTLKEGEYARFPDARTTRGQKHLKTLMEVKKNGMRAVMLYIIQRTDVDIFGPAWDIDPDYASLLSLAHSSGVEIFPFQIEVSPNGFKPKGLLPFKL
ncbi:MAG: DNA/RNA nuclease SfsA [Bacteroidales bacterium]